MNLLLEASNMALTHVRGQQISALNDTSEESRLCARFAVRSMEQTLATVDWGFARKVVQPVRSNTAPRPGWGVTLVRPSDAVAIRSLSDSIHGTYNPRHKFELGVSGIGGSQFIYAMGMPETLVYTTSNLSQVDPLFLSAWSWRLAWMLAYPLTADRELQKQTLQIATQELAQAQAVSLNQGLLNPREDFENDPDWIAVR